MKRWIALLLLVIVAAACSRKCEDSLVPALPRAQFVPETWLIDFGLPDFRIHLVSGWGADEQWGEQRIPFVWSSGPSSVLRLNRYGQAGVKLRFRCAPKTGEQVVTTLVNNEPVATTALGPGFAIHEVAVPAPRSQLGENRIEFRYRSPEPVAWDWLEILEPRARPTMRTPRKTDDAVIIPYRSALRYELDLQPKSVLVIDAIDVEGEINGGDRGRVLFTIGDAGRPSFETSPDGKPQRITLGVVHTARVEIMVLEPRSGAPTATAVILRKPRIVGLCR
jgi:hypothetical protein